METVVCRSSEEIRKIRRAGKIVAECHRELHKRLKAGMKTEDIERLVTSFFAKHGAVAAQKGFKGYPYASCVSVNEVACHGFPGSYELKRGDVVTVDMVADVGGWKADAACTYMIGEVKPEVRKLVRAAKAAMRAGIEAIQIGRDLSDIGYAIERRAELDGYKVVPSFAGHGIGMEMHEQPQVLHVRTQTTGIKLQEGMVITIEPIISAGSSELYIAHDGWTARTIDHSLTAQFEHTVAVTKQGPQILTALTASAAPSVPTARRKKSNAAKRT